LGGLFPHQALHPYFKDVSKTMVQKAHQQGRQVNPWTVNEAADLRRMCDLGVDMIICNDPIAARQVLEV
jgi:glycerophosphoryl diester phosphodiesterase